jgi:leucyl aminopeptidase
MSVIDKQEEFDKNYPCFSAVNRAARGILLKLVERFLSHDYIISFSKGIERHRGRIIKLEYDSASKEQTSTSLFLIGKGLTYDTGGADVKYGGNMASMHRDKCGAAFVAGFFKTLDLLKPKGLKVHGTLCLTRNNIGEGISS